jgi:hypothetical protein
MNNAAKDCVRFWNNYAQASVVSKSLIEKFKTLATTGCTGEVVNAEQVELALTLPRKTTIMFRPRTIGADDWYNNTLELLSICTFAFTYEIFALEDNVAIAFTVENKNRELMNAILSKYGDCTVAKTDPLSKLIELSDSFDCEHYYPVAPFYRNLITCADKDTSTIYQLLRNAKNGMYYRVNVVPAGEEWILQTKNAFEYEAKVVKINPDINFQGFWCSPTQAQASKGLVEKTKPENLPLYFVSPSLTLFTAESDHPGARTFIKQLIFGDSNYRVKSDILNAISKDEYCTRLLTRQNILDGHLLNKTEVSSLVSFPCKKSLSDSSINLVKTTHLMPQHKFLQEGIKIGAIDSGENRQTISLPSSYLENSVAILGNQGFGKSTLLLNIIEQLHAEKQAIIVFYFHEIEFFKQLVANIPEDRLDDVVIATPNLNGHILCRNFVDKSNYHDTLEAGSDLCDAILTGANSTGINIEYVLKNIFAILLENENTCLSDYIEIIEKDSKIGSRLRDNALHSLSSPHLSKFISSLEKKGLDSSVIHNKFSHLFSTKNLCSWMSYRGESKLTYKDIVENKKILLYYLGGLSNAGPVTASIELANLYHHFLKYGEYDSTPFHKTCVIIDEAQKICCSSLSKSVRENRKYGERFIISTQSIQGVDSALKAGIDLCGNLLLFQAPEIDLKYFCEKAGKTVNPNDLSKLGKYELFARAMSASDVFSCKTLPYTAKNPDAFKYVVENSLKQYYVNPLDFEPKTVTKKTIKRSSLLNKVLNLSKGVTHDNT